MADLRGADGRAGESRADAMRVGVVWSASGNLESVWGAGRSGRELAQRSIWRRRPQPACGV